MRCLRKVLRDRAECLIIVPLWPTQIWYPELLKMLVDSPRILLPGNILSMVNSQKVHPLSSLSVIRRSYKVRNFSSKATDIILTSWHRGTQKQYITHIKKWFLFCDKKQIDSVHTDVNSILDFLTEQFECGCGYSSINTTRCAFSAIDLIKDGFAISAHPIAIRFMKGIFNLKPTKARYCAIWDVNKVLLYLQRLSPVAKLFLKMLTFKLAMLIALTLASRTQSIHLLNISNMKKGYDTYTLQYSDLLKQTKPGRNNLVAVLKAYPVDSTLIVLVNCLGGLSLLRN